MKHTRSRFRIIRGVALGLALSFVNLLGALLTVAALGGLGEWTNAQFLGLFGTIEIATGVAFIFLPNIWRLPVAEAKVRSVDIHFAASAIFLPHWAGGVKSIAGLILVGYAAFAEGVGFATPGLVLVVLAITGASVGISMLFARAGTARPDLDVYIVTIARPGKPDMKLPEISIGASIVQLILSMGTLPAFKLLPPGVLYQPEIGPSLETLAWCFAVAGGLLALGFASWAGRLSWKAAPVQQRDAEEAVPG